VVVNSCAIRVPRSGFHRARRTNWEMWTANQLTTRPLVAQSTLRCWVKSAWCRSRGATRGYWKRTITRRANPPCQGGMRVTGPSRLKLDMRRWDGRGRGMRRLHPGTLRRWVSKPLCTQQGLLCSPLAHGPVDMPNDLVVGTLADVEVAERRLGRRARLPHMEQGRTPQLEPAAPQPRRADRHMWHVASAARDAAGKRTPLTTNSVKTAALA
jgi:hypothetical protein